MDAAQYTTLHNEMKFNKGRIPRNLPENTIVVFGSNTAGWHGAGLARECKEYHGAIYGKGHGLQGQSYAIPTREPDPSKPKPALRTLPISKIAQYVQIFVKHIKNVEAVCENGEPTYIIPQIGCGFAGYSPYQIAPMFWELRKFSKTFFNEQFNQVFKEIEYGDGDPKDPRNINDTSRMWKDSFQKPKPGTFITLLSMPNEPLPIPSGTQGIVESVDGDQMTVKWDTQRSLMLLLGKDEFVCGLDNKW
tara:strand:+ start:1277 stop:2020 length:744 start_codon:yes stop_codon:yes gene_type:complete